MTALDERIGLTTAYGYAKSKGYTGTEEEFAQAMANAGITLESITEAVDAFINTTVPSAVQSVTTEGNTQVTRVTDTGTAQVNAVNTAGGTNVAAVNTAGDTNVSAVNSAGSTQVGNVNTAGTTQVGNVNTAGSTQVSAVQAKGQEVINSIPSDYTDLSNDVDDLKESFTDLNGYMNNIYSIPWRTGYYNASGVYVSNANQLTTDMFIVPAGAQLTLVNQLYGCYLKEYSYSNGAYTRLRNVGGNTQHSAVISDTNPNYFYVAGLYNSSAVDIANSGELTLKSPITDLYAQVDDLENALSYALNNEKQLVEYALEDGGINGSGQPITGSTYMRFVDYYSTESATDMTFNEKGGIDSDYTLFCCYYDENKVFKLRETTTAGYIINTDYAYFKLSFYAREGKDETRFRTWITWYVVNKIVDKFNEIDEEIEALKGGNTFSKTGNIITIGTNKAQYLFQRITNATINVDTWRLYSGNLKTLTGLFNMWINSDAEGVMKLVGEDDFIGGFHGDEIMTKITAVKDGVIVDLSQDFAEQTFNTLLFYVESDIYHCNTSASAGTKAFKRNKLLIFEDDKVRIRNCFEAVDNVNVQQASLAFFQCYKDDASSNTVLTNYSVVSDYKLYDTSNTGVYPANTKYITGSTYITKYGNICINCTLIDPRYAEYYKADVSIGTLISQNRLKTYYNTIPNTPQGVSMAIGDKMFGEFEWDIH